MKQATVFLVEVYDDSGYITCFLAFSEKAMINARTAYDEHTRFYVSPVDVFIEDDTIVSVNQSTVEPHVLYGASEEEKEKEKENVQ